VSEPSDIAVIQRSAGTEVVTRQGSLDAARDPRTNVNPANLYLLSLRSTRSYKTAVSVLNTMAKVYGSENYHTMDWASLTEEQVQMSIHVLLMTQDEILKSPVIHETLKREVRSREGSRQGAWRPKSLRTVNLYLSAVKGVMRYAMKRKLIDSHDYALIKDIKGFSVKGEVSKTLPVKAVDALKVLKTCAEDDTARGARDAAALALLYGAGMRRDEVRRLKISDIKWEARLIEFHGKGNKVRKPALHDWMTPILQKWIQEYRPHNMPGALLLAIDRWGNVQEKTDEYGNATPASDNLVYRIVKSRFAAAGLPVMAPHDLRRIFATALFEANVHISEIQQALGHQNIETTLIYNKTGEEKARESVRQHIPGFNP